MELHLPDVGSSMWNFWQLTIVEAFIIYQILSVKAELRYQAVKWEQRFAQLGEKFVDALVGKLLGDGVLSTMKDGLASWFNRKQQSSPRQSVPSPPPSSSPGAAMATETPAVASPGSQSVVVSPVKTPEELTAYTGVL